MTQRRSNRGHSVGGSSRPQSKAAQSKAAKNRAGGSRAGQNKVGGQGRSGGNRSGGNRPGGQQRSQGLDGTQVEGRQAVRELLLAGTRKCREIYMSADSDHSEIIGDIMDLAKELRVTITTVSRSKLDSMSRTEAPQGVLAMAAPLKDTPLSTLMEPGSSPFILAVDGVTDPGNLGALLRIAECSGVTGVVLPRHRAVHITPTVSKAAAGAIEYLPMALVGGMATAVDEMKSAGVWTVGLDMAGSESIHDLNIAADAVCLVLGSEGKGLSRLVRERCDLVASIPIHGRLESLNVAAAGAVATYEVARLRSR